MKLEFTFVCFRFIVMTMEYHIQSASCKLFLNQIFKNTPDQSG